MENNWSWQFWKVPSQVTSHSVSVSGFPGGSAVKNPPASVGDTGSTPGSGRPPRGGNGNPVHYPCLRNPMDRGAWWTIVRGVTKNRTQKRRIYKIIYKKNKEHNSHTTGSSLVNMVSCHDFCDRILSPALSVHSPSARYLVKSLAKYSCEGILQM